MQGMPIQNLMKSPVKGANSPKVNANSGEENSSTLESLLGSNVDFASLLEDIKSDEKSDPKVESSLLAKLLNHNKEVDSSELQNAIAKSTTSLDQLLNNLKRTNDNEDEESGNAEQNSLKNNLLLNQKGEKSEIKKDSPLDFLVKGSKENQVSELTGEEALEIKKSFMPNQAKIPNNILGKMAETDSKLNVRENLKLVSGEEFVDAKKISTDPKITIESMNANEQIDLGKLKAKEQSQSQVKSYQYGQNILNDNMIRNSKDLAFKEVKKGKLTAVDELMSPDMKKANELSLIKEVTIPVIANKENSMQLGSNGAEAAKVLDLSKVHTANTNALIEKISDYVMQSNVAGKDQLDLTVKHNELGQFQIQVNKNVPGNLPNQIDMQIMTSSQEGHKFFVENEGALLKSLQQSGLNMSDLRIVSNMTESLVSTLGDSKQSNTSGQGQAQNQNSSSSSNKGFEGFQSGDFKQGSEKRKDLWNEYRERYGA